MGNQKNISKENLDPKEILKGPNYKAQVMIYVRLSHQRKTLLRLKRQQERTTAQ